MSKKYIVKRLYIRCGCVNGRYYPDGFNCNCDLSEPCKRCQGTRLITITPKHPLFKEKYKEFISDMYENLKIKYRNAKKAAEELENKLNKYCKEHDKLLRSK